MSRRPTRSITAVAALCLLLTPLMVGAAASTAVRPAVCIPLLWCPKPSPTPTPSPTTSTPGIPLPGIPLPTAPAVPGVPTPSAPETTQPDETAPDATPAPAVPDEGAPIFTKTPAQMSSKGLSFTGLKGISLVTVPTIDGGSIRALKISADTITITGFALSVRPAGGPGLVTDADTMTLRGHVSVYLGSLTATAQNGKSLTIGADTPPSLDDVEPGLLHVDMGLVGTIADSISYTNTDQRIVAAK
ncbi:hypothetical protein QF046_000111 [Microbacterium sp. W4I4]|uniref:hypothetical protein n=1 Tax=Microbacterium sp. W4I4 TaxID=3042295 RepID=UPI00278665FA|nr:hypothetical protein [Microbacterium sp. W4I4]MDQ0612470.1 hypothetical protein [Microbacterium sp. W4I4]